MRASPDIPFNLCVGSVSVKCEYAAVLTVVEDTDGCSNALAAGTPTITDGRDVDQNSYEQMLLLQYLRYYTFGVQTKRGWILLFTSLNIQDNQHGLITYPFSTK